jgi:hypothetical protein
LQHHHCRLSSDAIAARRINPALHGPLGRLGKRVDPDQRASRAEIVGQRNYVVGRIRRHHDTVVHRANRRVVNPDVGRVAPAGLAILPGDACGRFRSRLFQLKEKNAALNLVRKAEPFGCREGSGYSLETQSTGDPHSRLAAAGRGDDSVPGLSNGPRIGW